MDLDVSSLPQSLLKTERISHFLGRFLYINKNRLEKSEIAAFVEFYLTEARKLVREVGYVPLGESAYAEALELVKGASIK